MAVQQNTNIPEIRETIVMLRQLSADEQVRQQAFYREKQLQDEANALKHARSEGKAERDAELAAKWRRMGYTEEQIKELLES